MYAYYGANCAECPFRSECAGEGNIKQNMKFREFMTRGIKKVKIEYNLVCSAHNLKVSWGKLERNVSVIGMIQALIANSASKVGNFLRLHLIFNFKCLC
jgi:hypothetical protein